MNDFSLDRRSTMSWPSLLVMLLAAWGILTTSPPMISERPRVESEQLRTTTGAQNIPARLWQDPLALAYQLEADGKDQYQPPSIDQVLGGDDVRQQEVLFLTVLLPGNNYAEGAEQCRRHRFTVVSALGQAHFAPRRSDAIGYVKLRPQITDSSREPLIVPFEWFEHKDNSQLVFLHWIDESQLSATPLREVAMVHDNLQAATNRISIRHAVLGPASSTTLKQMQQEKANPSGIDALSNTTIYSTQATADNCRQQSDAEASPYVKHVIGTDRELADAIVEELCQRRGISDDDTVALIAEWDTDYGRNMFNTFRAAIEAEQPGRAAKIREFKYLRGLDGLLPGKSLPADKDASIDVASGLGQIDYIRRLIVELQRSPEPLQAIGVLGSDVYDKLLLMKALRHEFPTAALFTTDLDDRLLNRREFPSTHNLLIASQYNLSLSEALQGAVPPFRSNYQTSLFHGTLVMLNDYEFIADEQFAAAIKAAERYRENEPPMLLFEVGRTGAFNLGQLQPNPLHPNGDRQSVPLNRNERILVVIGLIMTLTFLFFFRGFVQDFFLTAWRREFGWAHWLTLSIFIAAIGLGWLIWREHFSNPGGEPFALYEGISIWPTICWRLFLVGFCSFSVLRAEDELNRSYKNVTRTELGIESPWQRLSWREDFAKCWHYITSPHGWSWWIANNLSGWNRQLKTPVKTFAHRFAWNEWRRYGRWSQPVMQHFRVLPHLLLFLVFAILLFVILGAATSPARGAWSRSLNAVVFTVSGIFTLWLIFYVLDEIRLCNRWVEQVAADTARWPTAVLSRAAERFAAPDNETFHRILGLLLDVRIVARHTEVVARLVYAPCVALLVGFVARHPVFDNWSWAPQVTIVFGLSLLITFYSATVLGRSALRAKHNAVRTVEGIVSSLPWQSTERARAEALLQDIRSIEGGAMVPLRRNPLVAAALLPFGSLTSVYLLEFVLEQIGQ